ncbi:RHS repeat-associated core domain-containing protein, partial [Leptospira ellisii]
RKFDLLNKVTEITYPEGTKVQNHYSDSGYLAGVSLTPADGSSAEHPLVQYRGPILDGDRVKVLRELGNGVWTDIYIDKFSKRPLQTVTKNSNQVYDNLIYSYDSKGNISSIADHLSSARSQSFVYDEFNRLTSANGKYGSETYVYSDSGKLLQKGDRSYSYGDIAHPNAVTHVSSAGYVGDYGYDASGNMISRNGSVLEYDGFQKLKRMITTDHGTIEYGYDFTGTRIKKSKSIDGSKVITLGGLYEISYQPGFPAQHTLYFYGAGGERLGQWSSTTAVLRNEVSSSISFFDRGSWTWKNFGNLKLTVQGEWNGLYYKLLKEVLVLRTYFRSDPKSVFWLFSILLLLGICFVLLHRGSLTDSLRTQLLTPMTLAAMLTLVTNCNGFVPRGDGDAPWAMAPLLLPPGTPSIIGTPASPGSGVPNPGTPITGFLFFINDHLGSVTMALDGQGNRIGGGEWGGVSRVAYKPYGEIHRSDSGGPDVFRYKYTGQEEDRESGLYYYKARYYDPQIGRFTQADSILDTSRPNSQDLYMYTEGNPVNHTDPSGHSVSWGAIAAVTFPMFTLPAIGAAAVAAVVIAATAILTAVYVFNTVSMIAAAAAIGAIGIGVAVLGLASYLGTTFAATSLAVIGAAAVATTGFATSVALMTVSTAGATALGLAGIGLGAATFGLLQLGATGLGMLTLAALAGTTLVYTVIGMAAIPVTIAIAIGMPIVASAGYMAFTALGSFLSPYALQGYVAGGYSKSSFNNIHWDEKSARLGGCYGAAVSFGGAIVGPIYMGYGSLIILYPQVAKVVQFASYAGTLMSVIKGDWKSVGADLIAFSINQIWGKDIPIGLGLKYAEATDGFCQGVK